MSLTVDQLKGMLKEMITETQGETGAGVITAIQKHLDRALPIPQVAQRQVLKSFGQQVAENQPFSEWLKVGEKVGKLGNWGPMAIDHPFYSLKEGERLEPLLRGFVMEQKDVTATQFPVQNTVLPFTPFPRRRPRVRDLMPVEGIGTPRVDYAQVSGFSNNAATQIGEGTNKGQSEITTTLVQENAATIATFMAVSRQALGRVPQIRAWLDSTMEDFLAYEEDDQLLNGTGLNSLRGLLNAGVQLQSQVGGENLLTTIRKSITLTQTALGSGADTVGYTATGVIMAPATAETMDLLLDGNNRYLLVPEGGPPNDPVVRRVWGLSVIVTPAIATNRLLVGAFDVGSTLLIYNGLTFRASDSHENFFRQNKIALLAEYEAMHAVYSPKAYVRVTLI